MSCSTLPHWQRFLPPSLVKRIKQLELELGFHDKVHPCAAFCLKIPALNRILTELFRLVFRRSSQSTKSKDKRHNLITCCISE